MSSRQRYKPGKSPFGQVPGAKWLDYPGFIEPCHPTQHAKAPAGDRWIHEIKVDGCRCQLHIWHGAVLADIEYRAITADGRMRHGSFKGVREDFERRQRYQTF